MTNTSTDAVKALLDGVTPGKAVQFHPSYCEEARGAAFSDWDTSHHVSVIRSDDGSRYRIAEFRHASEAAFHQSARELVPALLAERDDLRAKLDAAMDEIATQVRLIRNGCGTSISRLNICCDRIEATLAKIKGADK